jgi:hypothetical protein
MTTSKPMSDVWILGDAWTTPSSVSTVTTTTHGTSTLPSKLNSSMQATNGSNGVGKPVAVTSLYLLGETTSMCRTFYDTFYKNTLRKPPFESQELLSKASIANGQNENTVNFEKLKCKQKDLIIVLLPTMKESGIPTFFTLLS